MGLLKNCLSLHHAKTKLGPTTEKERHLILDILRGLALADIALANFPEFALWTFLSPNEQAMMPTAEVDKVVRFLQFAFVDGKFYTIFSILFGIGFSLILARRSVSLFLRRMLILACIGFCHLMFIWSGDILLLYAVGGHFSAEREGLTASIPTLLTAGALGERN